MTLVENLLYVLYNLEVEVRSSLDGSLLWSWLADSDYPRNTIAVTNNHAFVATNINTYAIDL